MRFIYVILLSALSASLFAQDSVVYKFWIELKDKNNSPYSIDKPEAFLSERALARRKKQGIAITAGDLPVNQNYVNTISALPLRVLYVSKWMNAVVVETYNKEVMDKVAALPFVQSHRMLFELSLKEVRNKKAATALVERLMAMNAPDKSESNQGYGFGFNQINQLNGTALHRQNFKGKGMLIAVLDAGFYKANQMKTFMPLFDEGRILGTIDIVEGDTSVFEDDAHGMNVLSCMASNTPDKMLGTAPEASYWLIRTEDARSENPIEEANWIRGAEIADSIGVDLINSSLGYTNYDVKSMSYTYKDLNGSSLISRAAKICAEKGILVCNAAGNEGDGDWKCIGVPADADGIISVGGVNALGLRSDFSSVGPTADGRIKPTVCAQATETIVGASFNKFYKSQGTSFASPVLCGMAACLWQAAPDKKVSEIIDAIVKSGNNYLNPDNYYGYGIPDFELALKILGNDPNFDYSKNSFLKEIPSVAAESFDIQLYNAQKGNIEFTLKNHKGKVFQRKTVEAKYKDFVFLRFNYLPTGKKPITLEINQNGNTETFRINRIE